MKWKHVTKRNLENENVTTKIPISGVAGNVFQAIFCQYAVNLLGWQKLNLPFHGK